MTSIFRIATVATLATGLFAALPASAQGVATADALRAKGPAPIVIPAVPAAPGVGVTKPMGTVDPRTMAGVTADLLRARAAIINRTMPNIAPRVATGEQSINALARLRAKAAAEAQARLNTLRTLPR